MQRKKGWEEYKLKKKEEEKRKGKGSVSLSLEGKESGEAGKKHE